MDVLSEIWFIPVIAIAPLLLWLIMWRGKDPRVPWRRQQTPREAKWVKRMTLGMCVGFVVIFAALFAMPRGSWSRAVSEWLFGAMLLLPLTFCILHTWLWCREGKFLADHDFRVCPQCLYPLGTHRKRGRCPECGKRYDAEYLQHYWRRERT